MMSLQNLRQLSKRETNRVQLSKHSNKMGIKVDMKFRLVINSRLLFGKLIQNKINPVKIILRVYNKISKNGDHLGSMSKKRIAMNQLKI